MKRSIIVQNRGGVLPWRAHMSEHTTVGELELALSLLKLDIIRTTTDEILLVQTEEAIKDGVPPPDTQELAIVMFGTEADQALLVEDSGSVPVLEGQDRHFEEDADREMIGDDVDLGITNIGNK